MVFMLIDLIDDDESSMLIDFDLKKNSFSFLQYFSGYYNYGIQLRPQDR
jgi:hypothetical protein